MSKKWIMMSLIACVAGFSSVYAEEEITVQQEKNFGCPCKDKKPDAPSAQEEEKLLSQTEEEEAANKLLGCKDCNEEVSKFLSCKDCK
ncbi:MAG: hypothetical protein K2Y01_10410 [Rhabdochlamydiaceae bacterium]|nr:hypothetical protein [Rhabdochlamydiaceae bacterium]